MKTTSEFILSLRLRIDQSELLNSSMHLSLFTGLYIIPVISCLQKLRPSFPVCVCESLYPLRGETYATLPLTLVWPYDQKNIRKWLSEMSELRLWDWAVLSFLELNTMLEVSQSRPHHPVRKLRVAAWWSLTEKNAQPAASCLNHQCWSARHTF